MLPAALTSSPLSAPVVGGVALLVALIQLRLLLRRKQLLMELERWAAHQGYQVLKRWDPIMGRRTYLIGRTGAGKVIVHRLTLVGARWRTGYSYDIRTDANLSRPFPGQLFATRGIRLSRLVRPTEVRQAHIPIQATHTYGDRRYRTLVSNPEIVYNSNLATIFTHMRDIEGDELRIEPNRTTVFWEVPADSADASDVTFRRFAACHAMLELLTE